MEEDDWDTVMEVNSRSQFVVTKTCLPGMRSQSWGRVILIGSISSMGGGINGCHYAATKGALRYVPCMMFRLEEVLTFGVQWAKT